MSRYGTARYGIDIYGGDRITGNINVTFSTSSSIFATAEISGTISILWAASSASNFYDTPYEINVNTNPAAIYSTSFNDLGILYTSTSGASPKPIYEET